MLAGSNRGWIVGLGLLCCVAVVGCGGGEQTAEAEVAAEEAAPAVAVEELTLEARLARADAADGQTDQVVQRCAACKLGMQGSADHAVQFGGYEWHFCSEGCAHEFEANPEEVVLALEFPGEEAAEPEAPAADPEG